MDLRVPPKRARFNIDDIIKPACCPTVSSSLHLKVDYNNGDENAIKSSKVHPTTATRSMSARSSIKQAKKTGNKRKSPEIDGDESPEIVSDDHADNAEPPECAPAGNSPYLDNVRCRMEGDEMWKNFDEQQNEMIITKTGRRMFPIIKVAFSGVEPSARYCVFVDVVPVDNRRYRYAYNKSGWINAGKADPPTPDRLYMHPDSAFTGEQLLKQIVAFEKVKLTNNETEKSGMQLILNSMHKYQPRVHLLRLGIARTCCVDLKSTRAFDANEYKTFIFPAMEFTAVTAYQNQNVCKMKIAHNPFAKGFRDNSRIGIDFDDGFNHPFTAKYFDAQKMLMMHAIGNVPMTSQTPLSIHAPFASAHLLQLNMAHRFRGTEMHQRASQDDGASSSVNNNNEEKSSSTTQSGIVGNVPMPIPVLRPPLPNQLQSLWALQCAFTKAQQNLLAHTTPIVAPASSDDEASEQLAPDEVKTEA